MKSGLKSDASSNVKTQKTKKKVSFTLLLRQINNLMMTEQNKNQDKL